MLARGEVAEKGDVSEIIGDAFNRRLMCHAAFEFVFFSFLQIREIQKEIVLFDWPNGESIFTFVCNKRRILGKGLQQDSTSV